MATQSEIEMEKALVAQLETLGYERLEITNERDLVANLKLQLEKHNKLELARNGSTGLTDDEFSQVLSKLNRGDVFDRSKQLRKRLDVERADGTTLYLELFDTRNWCQNLFQVCRQITNKSADNHSRYDVTLLINGFPLVQIELKARGSEIRAAFDQIVRYRKKSYSSNSGIFDYIQMFIISNGVDTRYFANNKDLSYQFTFEWSDIENNRINRLSQFTEAFMEKCHLSKMIARYIVQHETNRALMMLRPYQYYAVEKILDRVKIGRGDGYIWHTTGSGKTLTSFKASQLLSNDPNVDKVMFVVDRRDLDYQTALEFNAFSADSVDTTENTEKLVKQLTDANCKLIVTTIQKLNAAISKKQFQEKCESVKDKKFIFIFDECHRSQFGETHQRICDFFPNRQMFGFTGTPIFDANVANTKYGKRTTEHLFGQALHKYVITDAIRDRNVLRFSVEYRDMVDVVITEATIAADGTSTSTQLDPEAANSKGVLESPARITKVVDDIIDLHGAKTHNREYNAMFCVASVDVLQTYYEIFSQKKAAGEHDLKIGTIFSCAPGEAEEFSGVSDQDLPDMSKAVDQSRLQFLEGCIADYNAMYGTSYVANDNKSFYDYYKDLSKRVKRKEVDILLVVNMFLTGFDAPRLNTLYADKNLKHHGLIQAFSRTNRVFDAKKSHGNVVCYRNLKDATDEALAIFANKNAKASIDEVIGTVIMQPYEDLIEVFRVEVEKLKAIAPDTEAVDGLVKEEDQLDFIVKFRDVLRLQNTLKTFSQFAGELDSGKLGIDEQNLLDYQSKYLDLREDIEAAERDKRRQKVDSGSGENPQPDTPSPIQQILFGIDFQIELIKRDEITVSYILGLIEKLKDQPNEKKFEAGREMILDVLQSNPDLRSKRALFETFIDEELDKIDPAQAAAAEGFVIGKFNEFVEAQKAKALDDICKEFDADCAQLANMYQDFVYRGTLPNRTDLLGILNVKPRITKRTEVADAMRERFIALADVYEDAEIERF